MIARERRSSSSSTLPIQSETRSERFTPVAPQSGVLDWPANLIAVSEGGPTGGGAIAGDLGGRRDCSWALSDSLLALRRTNPDRLNRLPVCSMCPLRNWVGDGSLDSPAMAQPASACWIQRNVLFTAPALGRGSTVRWQDVDVDMFKCPPVSSMGALLSSSGAFARRLASELNVTGHDRCLAAGSAEQGK